MSDPRKATCLNDAALNDDGETYNGAKALSWLSEALNPGKGLGADEVQRMFDEAKAKREGARD